MKRPNWMLSIGIGLDQLLNAALGGDIDETLSSRTYRRSRSGSKGWRRLEAIIDKAFFWQDAHCRSSYRHERQRRQQWLELHSHFK